jgi:hypothetical protein
VHRAENRQATNMKILLRISLLISLLVCFLWGEACPSVEVNNLHLSNTTLMRAERVNRFRLLFAQQTQDSTEPQTPPSLKLKSPYMAVFYSVVPGTVLHGAGHVYAGKTGTGVALFAVEFVGLVFMSAGAVAHFEKEEMPDDGRETAAFVGLVMFFGSWVYDLIESPVAVNKRNRALLQQRPANMEIRMMDGQAKLVMVWRF